MGLYGKIIDLQKLHMAWNKVRKNKPAAGIDDITWEQFDTQKTEELKALNKELADHIYIPMPVKCTKIYRNEKEREIALYSMRDKTVQQSVSEELNKIYDDDFSQGTYAYRNGRSALQAVDEIERMIKTGRYSFVLKIDIVKFFDNIRWDILAGQLRQKIREEDVIELIRAESLAPWVDREGNLQEKIKGIYQGSCISPILSNIYLMEFDKSIAADCQQFFRYSDDILILGRSKEELLEMLARTQSFFDNLGLTVSEEKSKLVPLSEGVSFLGYYFTDEGKGVPPAAKNELSSRLEMQWLMNRNLGRNEKLQKAAAIMNGWQQYFRGETKIGSILEYAALVYMMRGKEDFPKIANKRGTVVNIYKDLMEYFQEIWQELGRNDLILLEYEQFIGITGLIDIGSNQELPAVVRETDSEDSRGSSRTEEFHYACDLSEKDIVRLNQFYKKVIDHLNEENLVELLQEYTDIGSFAKAERIADIITRIQREDRIRKRADDAAENTDQYIKTKEEVPSADTNKTDYSDAFIEKYMDMFVGREDQYAEIEFQGSRKMTVLQSAPFTLKEIKKHLSGDIAAATYVQRTNATAKYLVIDVDVSRRILLAYQNEQEKIDSYLRKAAKVTNLIGGLLAHKGFDAGYEFSGIRGYHIWVFFDNWIPVRYINLLTDILEGEIKQKIEHDDITIEYFPNKSRVKPGHPGQCIKLPLCTIGKYKSLLLNDDLSICKNIEEWMDSRTRHPLSKIKRIIATESNNPSDTEHESLSSTGMNKLADEDISVFGELPSAVTEVLSRCNLIRYLCRKSLDTGYLTHFERLTVLYVFGHMGDEGREFIHQVMRYTMNYRYNVTEKFIRKCPEKPISCVKLRDQYRQITAEIGCSCTFKRRANCYPSPVLHAISKSADNPEQITLPVSSTLTKVKKQEVADKLNIHKNTQRILSEIVDLKKQKRKIDSLIKKQEKELEKIFDEVGIDRLEIEMGTLVRIRTRKKVYVWKIEI